MSLCHSQALIHAPAAQVWDLVGQPDRHPEWWPRVVEVKGERFDQGDNYAQVTREPMGHIKTIMTVERLEDLQAIHLRCTMTGTYARWLLTEAQGNTFVDVEFGMDPIRIRDRILDKTIAKPYFRRWLDESLKGLERAAAEQAQPTANL